MFSLSLPEYFNLFGGLGGRVFILQFAVLYLIKIFHTNVKKIKLKMNHETPNALFLKAFEINNLTYFND